MHLFLYISYQYLWGTYNVDMPHTGDPYRSLENSGQARGYKVSFVFLLCFNLPHYAKVDDEKVCLNSILSSPHSVVSPLLHSMKNNGQREVRVTWSLSTSCNWYLSVMKAATLKAQASEWSGLWDQETERKSHHNCLQVAVFWSWTKIPEMF